MKTLKKSLVVEAAIAGLFAAAFVAPVVAQDQAPKGDGAAKPAAEKKEAGKKPGKSIHCAGVNSCKGTSECSVEGKSQCKGQNACKGQGWISLSKKDCRKQKGTVVAEKKAAAPAPAPAAAAPAAKQ